MRRLTSLLRGVLLILCGLATTVVSALGVAAAAFLFTQGGADFVLRTVEREYGSWMPGEVRVDRIEGCPAFGLRLSGIRLGDRTGASLIEVGRLDLVLDAAALLRGKLSLPLLSIEDALVSSVPDGYADLAADDDALSGGAQEASPDASPEGPFRLPFAMGGNIRIQRAAVVEKSSTGEPMERAEVLRFEARLDAHTADADLTVTAADIRLEGTGMDPVRIDFRARWEDSRASVLDFHLSHAWGGVRLSSARVDFVDEKGAVEGAVLLRKEKIADRISGWTDDATLYFRLKGGLDAAEVEFRISADKHSTLIARGAGRFYPDPDFKVSFDVKSEMPVRLSTDDGAAVDGGGLLLVKGPDYPQAEMTLDFSCATCRLPPFGTVGLELDAALVRGSGPVHASLTLPDASLVADALLERFAPIKMHWRGAVASIETLFAPLGIDALRGFDTRVEFSGKCEKADGSRPCDAEIIAKRVSTPFGTVRRATLSGRFYPFDPSLPFESTAQAEDLRVSGGPRGSVRLAAKGDRRRVRGDVSAKLKGGARFRTSFQTDLEKTLRLRIASLRARYRGLGVHLHRPTEIVVREDAVSVSRLKLGIAGGTVSADGAFPFEGEGRLDVGVEGLQLAKLSGVVPVSALSGRVDATFAFSGAPAVFDAALVVDAKGVGFDRAELGNFRLSAEYRPGRLTASLIAREGVSRRIEAEGFIGADIDLADGSVELGSDELLLSAAVKQLNIGKLGRLVSLPDIAGKGDLRLDVKGTARHPRLSLAVEADNLSWRTIALGALRLSASYAKGRAVAKACVTGGAAEQLTLSAAVPAAWDGEKIVWNDKSYHHVSVVLERGRPAVLKSIQAAAAGGEVVQGVPLSGTVNLTLNAEGNRYDPILDLFADAETLTWEGAPFATAAVALSVRDRAADLHAQIFSDQNRYADLKAIVPFSISDDAPWIAPRPRGEHVVDFQFAGFQSEWVALLMPSPPPTRFQLSGGISGKGRFGDFTLRGEVHGDVSPDPTRVIRVHGRVDADPDGQSATLTVGDGGTSYLNARLSTHLPGKWMADTDALLAAIPLDGRLEVPSLDLSRLSAYLPDSLHNAEGRLLGDVTVSGTAAAPSMDGEFRLSGGAITIAPLYQRFRDISFTLAFRDRAARIDDLAFRSGQGDASGRFSVSQTGAEISGNGEIRFEKFPLVKPGLPKGLINAKLGINVTKNDALTHLRLTVKDGYVHIMDTAAGTVPKDIRQAERLTVEGDDASGAEQDGVGPAEPFRMTVDISDPVEIRGQGIEMIWGGDAVVDSDREGTRVSGSINAKPGRLRMIGNIFEIESGIITFPESGELDPFVDLVATVRTEEALVTATLKGRAAKPELTLTSDPSMTQYQILTLLLTGQSDTTAESDSETDIPTQAASLLMSFSNPELERQLYEKLGVDRISVSMGSTLSEPIVAVGKRLGKRVYIESEYHHNAPEGENRAAGRIEYRLAPGWSVETEFGDAQKGEFGVYWQKRFGGSKKKAE